MKPFSETPIKLDAVHSSELPETNTDCSAEAEDWHNGIELPDDTGSWVDSIKLSDEFKEWQNKLDLLNPLQEDIDAPSDTATSSENADTNAEGSESQTYPCEKTVDGEKYYYDSQGNFYRVGDQLLPNNSYEMNGYTYKTDELGRIISAEGKLRLKDDREKLKIKDSMEVIGKGDQKVNDDRGHLIGDRFDGSNGLENLVAQDSTINRVDFRNFESELAKEVQAGNDVRIKVEPIYDGDSQRPSAIVVTYSINGDENIRIFPND